MVLNCVVSGCNNLQDSRIKISFHTFPFKRPKILRLWIQAIKRENWSPSKTSRICGMHFLETDYKNRPGCSIKLLKPDAVPSVFTFPKHLQQENKYVNKCKQKGQASGEGASSGEGSSSAGNAEINKNTRVGNLPTAEVNFEDNTDDQTHNIVEVKAKADDADVHLETSETTSEDNSKELGHDPLDYVDEIKTEVSDSAVNLPTTAVSFEDNVNETSHDQPNRVSEVKTEADEIDIKEEELNETRHGRVDYVSKVKTEPDDIDIEEELGNPSPINSVHSRKRTRLDIEHASVDLRDAVKTMKSPLQEDEDLAFFYSLLPAVRSLNADQKSTFRLRTVQVLQDIRNSFGIDASSDTNFNM
ncbi:unnamed protein product [Tenebrio molitor]|nr:unnamed protein product [Tenebrio molitor]